MNFGLLLYTDYLRRQYDTIKYSLYSVAQKFIRQIFYNVFFFIFSRGRRNLHVQMHASKNCLYKKKSHCQKLIKSHDQNLFFLIFVKFCSKTAQGKICSTVVCPRRKFSFIRKNAAEEEEKEKKEEEESLLGVGIVAVGLHVHVLPARQDTCMGKKRKREQLSYV